jgi:hypothetical protein
MADIVERLVVLSKAVSAKMWNGLADGLAVVGNPCAVVDVQRTISKRAAASSRAESERESTSALVFDDDDKEEADAEALEEDQVPLVGAKKSPRPLKNGIVLSEAGARERRNLLELMARIDGVAGQRFGISRARTVRGTGELIEKDAVLLLRRNKTVRVVGSEALPKSERVSHFDVKIKRTVGKEQEKAEEIQAKAGGIQKKEEKNQENACGTQENSKEIAGKVNKLPEQMEANLDKKERIQEKNGQNLEKAESVTDNGVKIQGAVEKVRESEGEIQNKAEKILLKSGES